MPIMGGSIRAITDSINNAIETNTARLGSVVSAETMDNRDNRRQQVFSMLRGWQVAAGAMLAAASLVITSGLLAALVKTLTETKWRT